jgi:polyisoprenoid-binding protein YceI
MLNSAVKVQTHGGVEVYGYEAEATIYREEFGLTWNAALETGGVPRW